MEYKYPYFIFRSESEIRRYQLTLQLAFQIYDTFVIVLKYARLVKFGATRHKGCKAVPLGQSLANGGTRGQIRGTKGAIRGKIEL